MIGELSQVMVNLAKVEVDYTKATGQTGSAFLEKTQELPLELPASTFIGCVNENYIFDSCRQ